MRVLVTGAFGFVGRAVVPALLDAGHDVVATTSRQGAPDDADLRIARIVTWMDLLRPADLAGAVEGVDSVVHLAAATRVRASFADPASYFASNTGVTIALIQALERCRQRTGTTPRLVFASTAAVYGAPKAQPMTEETPIAPTSPYGASKAAAEQAIDWQARAGALAAVTLRCSNIAGATGVHGDPDGTRIIPAALNAAAGRTTALRMNGDGSVVRDFVHVADVAGAFVRALDAAEVGRHHVFNVGGVLASVADVVEAVEGVTGRPVPVDRQPAASEPQVVALDTTRARDVLGWAPKRRSLPEIIATSWAAIGVDGAQSRV